MKLNDILAKAICSKCDNMTCIKDGITCKEFINCYFEIIELMNSSIPREWNREECLYDKTGYGYNKCIEDIKNNIDKI